MRAGANPRQQNPDRAPAGTEAGQIGHWLAAESIHAWIEGHRGPV
jgi:hypothetical protein